MVETVGMVQPSATTVLLCRGCCCGTSDKHPRTDHGAQEQALLDAAARSAVEVRVVDCLDECDRSNVAVVRRAGLRASERDTWLGGLLTERAGSALAAWVADGAQHPLPPALVGLRFRHLPPRRRNR